MSSKLLSQSYSTDLDLDEASLILGRRLEARGKEPKNAQNDERKSRCMFSPPVVCLCGGQKGEITY